MNIILRKYDDKSWITLLIDENEWAMVMMMRMISDGDESETRDTIGLN